MSVVVMVRMQADADRFASVQEARADEFRQVAEKAKAAGCRSHRFVAGAGEMLVVDEWPDAGAFQSFFADPTIASFMEDAGVQGPPKVEIFEAMETVDQF